MDGTFVPNITLGPCVVESLRKVSKAVFDVHLMVEHPETHIEPFAKAGADIITFHVEATRHAHRVIQQIKAAGCKAGIALNPGTSIYTLEELIDDADMVLLMTVNPGFGGQKFIENTVGKIHALYHTIADNELDIDIEVDGGINAETAESVRSAGQTYWLPAPISTVPRISQQPLLRCADEREYYGGKKRLSFSPAVSTAVPVWQSPMRQVMNSIPSALTIISVILRALVRKEDRRALSRGRASHHRDEYECCRRIGAD